MISICTKTIQHFRTILQNNNSSRILLSVKGGGCNGLKYVVTPTNEKPMKLDEVLNKDGVEIVVCGKSMMHLIGTEVKWVEDVMGSRLEFTNPNATSTCGCGETFGI